MEEEEKGGSVKYIIFNIGCLIVLLGSAFFDWIPYPKSVIIIPVWLFGNVALLLGDCCDGPDHAGM